MPTGPGRFRIVTTRTGKGVRLHFKRGSNAVDEAKSLSSGKVHTPADFARDRRNRAGRLKGRRR